jgi:hypothetical protein
MVLVLVRVKGFQNKGDTMHEEIHDDFINTHKKCGNSPTGFCKCKGNLPACVKQKNCILPEKKQNG